MWNAAGRHQAGRQTAGITSIKKTERGSASCHAPNKREVMAGPLPVISCVEIRPCLASSRFHQKSQSSELCAHYALRLFAKPIELTAEGVIFMGNGSFGQ